MAGSVQELGWAYGDTPIWLDSVYAPKMAALLSLPAMTRALVQLSIGLSTTAVMNDSHFPRMELVSIFRVCSKCLIIQLESREPIMIAAPNVVSEVAG